MTAKTQILVVEDDENLRIALQDNLEQEGYDVVAVANGRAALSAVGERPFDLLVLDIMLPDLDGYTICRKVREAKAEAMILMLTARSLEDDIVRGFEAGADDYLAKPYRLRELLARIRALLRRRAADTTLIAGFAGFELDREARILREANGEIIELTRTEFDLLCCLLDNRGRAMSRQEILDQVWGEGIVVDTRTVDNFVSSLKKKLRWTHGAGFKIQTVRGVGYRMELDEP